jgi:hypothetical protein
MSNNLLPCPFCGSSEANNTSYEAGREVDGEVTYVIMCPDCWCTICPTLSLSEAIAAWNMRKPKRVDKTCDYVKFIDSIVNRLESYSRSQEVDNEFWDIVEDMRKLSSV